MKKLIATLTIAATLTLSACGGTHYKYSQNTKDLITMIFAEAGDSVEVANCAIDKMEGTYSENEFKIMLASKNQSQDDIIKITKFREECEGK